MPLKPERACIWIKICGNTTAEDALSAAALGANAVGFVFAPGGRRVNAAQVRSITASLPDDPQSLERVGVFPAASLDEIAADTVEARLHAVQLHGGGFDPVFVEALSQRLGPDISIIHTLHWSVDPQLDSAREITAQLAHIAGARPAGTRVLVDTRVGESASGGTGRSFDWHAAQGVLASQPGLKIVVAGGLRPQNVTQAIQLMQPWGVDVASGVEQEPGRKDLEKIAAFVKNAREA